MDNAEKKIRGQNASIHRQFNDQQMKTFNNSSLFDDPEFQRMKSGVTRWAITGGVISIALLTGAIVTIIWAIKHL